MHIILLSDVGIELIVNFVIGLAAFILGFMIRSMVAAIITRKMIRNIHTTLAHIDKYMEVMDDKGCSNSTKT